MIIQRPQTMVEQVKKVLRQRIRDRVYPPGGRLPSESELAQELGVSRATVRSVLARLASDGLILRKQGDGTYVNERIRDIDARYGGVWDFSRLIASNGYQPSIRTLSLENRGATEVEAKALSIEINEAVVALVRLFYADDCAAIHVTNIIAAERLLRPIAIDDGKLPIHVILRNYCSQAIAYAITDVRATHIDTELTSTLNRSGEQPLIKLIETFYNDDNQPLVYGVSYFDDAVIRLRLVQAWG